MKKANQYQEQYAEHVANCAVQDIFDADNQAEAMEAITDALVAVFSNADADSIKALAGGFAVSIVNVLERGRDAIKGDAK